MSQALLVLIEITRSQPEMADKKTPVWSGVEKVDLCVGKEEDTGLIRC